MISLRIVLNNNIIKKGIEKRKFSILFSKGRGIFGSTGRGNDLDEKESISPVIDESGDPLNLGKSRSISAGWGHSAAVNENGEVYIFGRPYDFNLLLRIHRVYRFSKFFAKFISKSSNNSKIFGKMNAESFPLLTFAMKLPYLEEEMRDVKCSAGFTTLLSESGDLYSFGLNRWNQCGVLSDNIHVMSLTKVEGLKKCIQFDLGFQHGIALDSNGSVFAWGKGERGQLGIGKLENSSSLPYRVEISKENNKQVFCKAVSAGFNHSAALSTEGNVYIWGKAMSDIPTEKSSENLISFKDQYFPRKIMLPEGRKAVEISSGNFSLVIRAEDGTLWIMGIGEYDRNCVCTPLKVETDYHPLHPNDKRSNETDLIISKNSFLRKGHNRVSLVLPKSNYQEESQSPEIFDSDIFNIILHNREAYIKPAEFETDEKSFLDTNISTSKRIRVRDVSEGWLFSLILLDEI